MFELLSSFKPSQRQQNQHQGWQADAPSASYSLQSVSRRGPAERLRHSNVVGYLKSMSPTRSGASMSNATWVQSALVCVVVFILLQSVGQAKKSDLDSQEGKPCICNSTFFRYCPPAVDCLENNVSERTTMRPRGDMSSGMDYDYMSKIPPEWHDDYDPDHVPSFGVPSDERLPDKRPRRRPSFKPFLPPIVRNSDTLTGKVDADGRIVTHQKVYVSPMRRNKQPVIYPINIRIPVNVPVVDEPEIPTPKKLFKLKKYVTYESRPEIQMVPVTKTIIKPIGITQDQIVKSDVDEVRNPKKLDSAGRL